MPPPPARSTTRPAPARPTTAPPGLRQPAAARPTPTRLPRAAPPDQPRRHPRATPVCRARRPTAGLRQRRDQRHPSRHANRRVERRRHHRRQPTISHDLQRPTHPAQRRDLDDDEVRRPLYEPPASGRPPCESTRQRRWEHRFRCAPTKSATPRDQRPPRTAARHTPAGMPRAHRAPAARAPTSHPPFASTRIRPSIPRISRTAATRSRSSASPWPASAHLDLGRRAPGSQRQPLQPPSRPPPPELSH